MNRSLTAIEGLRVGHAEDRAGTGCSVILLDPMADVAYEARGGYPTTFDTDGIDLGKRYVKRHAVFLAGGDVYGLDSPPESEDTFWNGIRNDESRGTNASNCGCHYLRHVEGRYSNRKLS